MIIRKATRLLVSGLLLAVLVVGTSAPVGSYIEQTQISVRLSGPNVVKCNRSATLTARVVSNTNGKPVRQQLVKWRLTGARSGRDGLSAGTTITNRRGRTSVTLSFGPVAGARTVTATATRSTARITVRCAGGLPKTSIRLPDGQEDAPSQAMLPAEPLSPSLGSAVPVRSLRMARLGIDLPVTEGDGATVPEGYASHFPGTSWPGEGSNTYIYAHAREGNFLELWQARTGDAIELDMADGSVAEYRVSEVVPLVPWDALEYLEPTSSERLTLQTSLWYDDTSPRFIVIAERVSGA